MLPVPCTWHGFTTVSLRLLCTWHGITMGAVYQAWNHYRCSESGMISLRSPLPGLGLIREPCTWHGFTTGAVYLAWVYYECSVPGMGSLKVPCTWHVISTGAVYLEWVYYGCRVPRGQKNIFCLGRALFKNKTVCKYA